MYSFNNLFYLYFEEKKYDSLILIEKIKKNDKIKFNKMKII